MDNKSYDVYVDIYEKVGLNNPSYENSEPHEYLITTGINLKSTDTKEKWFSVIESCVKQCIEIDTIPENSTVKVVCSVDSNTYSNIFILKNYLIPKLQVVILFGVIKSLISLKLIGIILN